MKKKNQKSKNKQKGKDKRKTFIDKCFKDSKGNTLIYQSPNIPIILFVIFYFLSMLTLQPDSKLVVRTISFAFLAYWSYLEIRFGENYFRKTLGILGIIFILLGFIILL